MKTDDFMSLITKEEPLCEELQQWVQELSNGMKMVNHPLVQDMIFNEACCALFNERLKFKTAEVKKAYAEDNWHRYVFLHERPYRFEALMRVGDEGMPLHKFSKLVTAVWMDSENIWQHYDDWVDVFEYVDRPYLMNPVERGVLRKLPNRVTIYRGFNGDRPEPTIQNGLSWTLSMDKAKWFAKRYGAKKPTVLEIRVDKDDIIAYFNGRNEQEIVYICADEEPQIGKVCML
jgi:hypothetical protein